MGDCCPPPDPAGGTQSTAVAEQSLQYPLELGDGALPQLVKFAASNPEAATDPCINQVNKPKEPLQLMGLTPVLRPGPSWR